MIAALEFLDYDFMRRALIAAMLVGVTAPAAGIFLVQRRLALIGDGLGHVAVTGVGLGLVRDVRCARYGRRGGHCVGRAGVLRRQ